MNEPTHLDLFSGIGGFALAARWAGFRTIGFSEVDPYASAVLRKHWPDVPNFGDITKWRDWPDLGDVQLITGGFPCQPFSCAGKRRGAADDRFLWPSMLAVIGRYKPAWVLGENVPGIIGMELDRVLADLEGIGYAARPIGIPACALGADHARKRVWIVAHAACSNEKPEVAKTRPVFKPRITSGTQSAVLRRIKWPQCLSEMAGNLHGISRWTHRTRAIGNAIVPQVAQVILGNIRKLIA